MGLDLTVQYPGQVGAATAEFPYGVPQNITVPGDNTGTPWEAAIVKDGQGFLQALLISAAIVPSGSPDEVGASDYLDSIKTIISVNDWNVGITYPINATVRATNGRLYVASVAQAGNNPIGDPVNWGGDFVAGQGLRGLSVGSLESGNATAPAFSIDSDNTGAGTGIYGENISGASSLSITVDGVRKGTFDQVGDFDLVGNGMIDGSLTLGGGGVGEIKSIADIDFFPANVKKVRISATGNMYFNGLDTAPDASNFGIGVTKISADQLAIFSSASLTSVRTHSRFYNPNGIVGTIQTTGSATAYNTASDERLKSPFESIGKDEAYELIVSAHENLYTGKFNWLIDPDGPMVWGYNSQALCENQEGFGGSEGEGPKDATLGEGYEQAVDDEGNLLFEDVKETKSRQEVHRHLLTEEVNGETKPKYKKNKMKKTLKQHVKYVDGKAIQVPETEAMIKVQDYIDIPVEDIEGNPVMEEYTEIVGKTPVMHEVTPYAVDQSKRVPVLEAALYHLIKEVEELKNA